MAKKREQKSDEHWVVRVTPPVGDDVVYEFDLHPQVAMANVSEVLLDGVRVAIREGVRVYRGREDARQMKRSSAQA